MKIEDLMDRDTKTVQENKKFVPLQAAHFGLRTLDGA